jgi:hypothetical protein
MLHDANAPGESLFTFVTLLEMGEILMPLAATGA